MKQDVQHYIRYYNQTRLHTANDDLSPIDFELSPVGLDQNSFGRYTTETEMQQAGQLIVEQVMRLRQLALE